MRSIFEFIDYRQYLKDYYEFNKKTSRAFSYRYFSAKAGYISPVFLKLVIDHERNLSRASIDKFCKALKLENKEAAYFKNLVLFDQAKTFDDKQVYHKVMLSIANWVPEKILAADQYDYFNNWYNVVIRELATLIDFKNDYGLLASCVQPPITADEAEQSIELLSRNKLIVKKPGGGWKKTDAALTTNDSIGSMLVRRLNREMIVNALKGLDKLPKEKCHISGITVGVSSEMFDILNAEIMAFNGRIIALVNKKRKNNCVFQLNIQLFPVSKKVKSRRKTSSVLL
jgi:uncharacterized protein (TIGR02147 family)